MTLDSPPSTPSVSPSRRALKRLLSPFGKRNRKNKKQQEEETLPVSSSSSDEHRKKVSIEEVVIALQNEAKKGELLDQYRELKESGSFDTSTTPVTKNANAKKKRSPRRKKESSTTDSETSDECHTPPVTTLTLSSSREESSTTGSHQSRGEGGAQTSILRGGSPQTSSMSTREEKIDDSEDMCDSALDPLGDSMISAVTLPATLRKNVRFSKDVKKQSSDSTGESNQVRIQNDYGEHEARVKFLNIFAFCTEILETLQKTRQGRVFALG